MKFQSKQVRLLFRSLDRFFRRKTVRGFAGQIASIEQLAPPILEALRPYLKEDDPVVKILNAPAQSVLVEQEARRRPPGLLPWMITPNRVLVLTASRLLVASSAYVEEAGEINRIVGGEYLSEWAGVTELPEVEITPLGDILYLELGTILLFSWLDWSRMGKDGKEVNTRVYFNTVSRSLFEDLAGLARRAILGGCGISLSSVDQGLERLEGMPYKFKSLIPKHLLLPGEQIQATLFRPSLWERNMVIFRRHVAPKLAVIRTNGTLMIAQEDLTSEEDSYGLITQFCTLPYVRRMTLEETPSASVLVVQLAQDGTSLELRYPFPPQYWHESIWKQ